LAAKAARAGGGVQRSESDADEHGGGDGGKLQNSLLSLPDPSAWPFAAALRGDSIADGDERHLQVRQRRESAVAAPHDAFWFSFTKLSSRGPVALHSDKQAFA